MPKDRAAASRSISKSAHGSYNNLRGCDLQLGRGWDEDPHDTQPSTHAGNGCAGAGREPQAARGMVRDGWGAWRCNLACRAGGGAPRRAETLGGRRFPITQPQNHSAPSTKLTEPEEKQWSIAEVSAAFGRLASGAFCQRIRYSGRNWKPGKRFCPVDKTTLGKNMPADLCIKEASHLELTLIRRR